MDPKPLQSQRLGSKNADLAEVVLAHVALDLQLPRQARDQHRHASEAAHRRRPVRSHRTFERVVIAALACENSLGYVERRALKWRRVANLIEES